MLRDQDERDRSEIPPWRTAFEIVTYVVLIAVLFLAFWTASWSLNVEMISILLILTGYTVVLVLPVKWFKITPSGIEGEIARLQASGPTGPVSKQSERKAAKIVSEVSQALVDPRSVFLDLSIEIEKRLRELAQAHGIARTLGMAQLISEFRKREVITDPWLFDALEFYRGRRNQIVHEGRVDLIQSAIGIGKEILSRLPE